MSVDKPKLKRGRPPRTPDPCEHMHIWIRTADADFIRDYATARRIPIGEVIERLVQAAR